MMPNPNFNGKEISINIGLYDESFYGSLKEPQERVRYAMGITSRIIAHAVAIDKPVSPANPIVLSGQNYEAIRHLWTAGMVFGHQHSSIKFDEQSITNRSCYFDADKEFRWLLGFKWGFASDSLYNTMFKQHVTPDMLEPSETAPLFEGISGELPIEEQYAQWLQRCGDACISSTNIEKIPATEIEETEEIEKHLISLIEILYEYKKVRGRKPGNYNEGYLSWAGYSKTEKSQVVDKIFAWLGLEKMLDLSNEDITIFHQGNLGLSIDAWEKSTGLGIDKKLAQKIAPHLGKLKGTCSFILGTLHEQDNRLQPAMNYYSASLKQGYPEACELFKSRGEEGDTEAFWLLAWHYHHSKKEYLEAVCLCIKAALLGHANAETYVRESKFAKAIEFLDLHKNSEENALQVHDIAMHLAIQYETHQTPSNGKAFQAYLVAAKGGNKDALDALERLGTKVSPKKQYKLGELYASFFANTQGADFWNKRAKEVESFSFPEIQP